MADIPSRSVAKRVSLGSLTASAVANTRVDAAASAAVNLAKQALPIQGGIIGSFNGATVVATVTTAITGAGATVDILLQGSHDGTTFFNLAPAISAGVQNKFSVGATLSPSGAIGQVTSMSFHGPLPQFIRGSILSGATAPTAGVVSLEAIVLG